MEQVLKGLTKVGDGINLVARVLLGITSIMLCVAVIGQFILRWIGMSMPWASEFSCYIFVWTTMLGSAIASRHLLHIGVDMLINLFQGKTKMLFLELANVVLLIALGIFVYSSTLYTIDQIPHMATTMPVSLAVFYVSLPISGLIMIYYTVIQILEIAVYGEVRKLPLPGDEG